ncbi:MAG: hypothetical protein NW224_25725 [Leptolyngbyaceae cyanobacterium bins.302]|nr:hypothetical protein [Leptolyngbyaceae cyanobacterium bins.302]
MSIGSRVNAALAAVNVQFVRKTGLERLRLLEQEFQALLSEYQALKSRYERLSDRLHLSDPPFDQQTSQASRPTADLPDGASYLLIPSNTRLTDLVQRYRSINHPVMASSLWTDAFVQQEVDLYRFRANKTYLSPLELDTNLHYALYAYYLKSIDGLELLDRLREDRLFGAATINVSGRPVSQDFLDAIAEIYFLERHLALSQRTQFNLLHIGAGYGRLAHWMVQAFPKLGKVFCTDAIATFSFLSEYYLKFRGVDQLAITVPFDELRATLTQQAIQVAINIRTFSESPVEAILGWVDLLTEFKVPYLMLIPDPGDHQGTRLLSYEKDQSRIDYQPLLEARGYHLIAHDPKFLDPTVQANGISPTYHFLFQRR